jgi:hypothetical protein
LPDDFDPSKVPPFPVVTLELRGDGKVLVDGRVIDVDEDADDADDHDQLATAAGVAAVAAIAASHGIDAVRVRATSPDATHPMVVTADGRAYDLDPTPDQKPPRKRTSGAVVGAIAFGSVLLLAGVGGTVYAITTAQGQAVPVATPAPPGSGANLPILAPPGYDQKATWAREASSAVDPLLLDDGRLALVDGEGDLAIVDNATGAYTWRGVGSPSGQQGIHVSEVQGRPVIVSARSEGLSVWPIDGTGSARVPAVSVDVGASADVSYLGSAPLVSLSSQTIAFLTDHGVVRQDLPVLSTPILATDDGAIAANQESWWTVPIDGEPERHDMPRPDGISGAPSLISAADDTSLIVVWPSSADNTDIATLVDLTENRILAQATVPRSTARGDDEPRHSPGHTTLTIGQLFVDYGDAPQLIALDGVEPSSLDGTTVYGDQQGSPVVARLIGGAFVIEPFTTLETREVEAPIAVTPQFAYVMAEKVEETLLYAVPRTTPSEEENQ